MQAASSASVQQPPTLAASDELFDASETRFLTDSLSSADTFDPFTVGAPGFKVPAVLPPTLGLRGTGGTSSGAGEDAGASAAAASTSESTPMLSPDTAARLGRQASAALGSSLNWEDSHHHRPSLFDPSWLASAAEGTTTGSGVGEASHSNSAVAASTSNLGNADASVRTAGAYGKDRAWQMAQLEALQAERQKYLAASQQQQQQQQQRQQQASSSSSSFTANHNAAQQQQQQRPVTAFNVPSMHTGPQHHAGYLPDEPLPDHPPGPHGQAYAAALARYKMFAAAASAAASQPNMMAVAASAPPTVPPAATNQLGMLGLSFPSMHAFPAAPGQPGGPPLNSVNGNAGGMAGMINGTSHHNLMDLSSQNWTSQLASTSQLGNGGGNVQQTQRQQDESSSSSRPKKIARSDSSKSLTPTTAAAAKGKGKAAKAAAAAAAMREEESEPPASLPAPMPPAPSIDVERGLAALPPQLHDAYLAASLERLQPHLELFRAHRRSERARDPTLYPRPSKDESSANAEPKKKAPHVLLTDAEKKANHIASEQKRRANIRKGYEVLCELVPSLREALEREDEEAANATTSGSTAAAGAAAAKGKKDWEVGGEKIDGRAGPRSESVVLLKTVEYLRQRLEEHRDLVLRREQARRVAAARFGADISLPGAAPGAGQAQGQGDRMEH